MYHSPRPFFDSVWPWFVASALAALLVLCITLRRSRWAVVPWVSFALGVSLCTFASAVILLIWSNAGHGGGAMFHPLAFARPIVVALIIGLPACVAVWWLRPAFGTLQRKHWIAAIIALPVSLLLLLNAPRIYNTDVVIQCEWRDGPPPQSVTLQETAQDGVTPIGTSIAADASHRFYITLNRRESFTAIISAPGYQSIRLWFFPQPERGIWVFFRGNEQLQLPLSSPGTQIIAMNKAPN